MRYMYEHYERVVRQYKYEIGQLVSGGKKFSVTLDEYTSIANLRFLKDRGQMCHPERWHI